MGLGAELVGQLDRLGDWGVLATDARLAVTGWNRWLVQHTGRAPATVLGRPLFDLFPDLAARRVDRYYREALAGHPVVLSQRLHRYILPMSPAIAGSGLDHMQQSVRIIPILDGPDAGGTVTLIEDVTERVTHETALRARARRQAALAGVARAALAGGELEDIARAAVGLVCETLGVEYAEVLEALPAGAAWVLLAGSGWPKPAVAVFEAAAAHRARAARAADGPLEAEDAAADPRLAADTHLRAHGVAAAVLVRVSAHAGQPARLLGAYSRARRRFTADETEFLRALADVVGMAVDRKRLEGELKARVRDLAEADRRKDEFLAMLAHELRNPLAPIRNGLQILRLAGDDPRVVAQNRDMIDRQVQHLSRLVDDLMDVSRITRRRVDLRRQPVDLAEVAGRAVEEVRPLIEARKHRLTVAHRAGPVRVNADPVRLTQVVANLLNNAAKYTDEGGEITLSVEGGGGEAVVRVRDTGVGISPEMLSRVFDLFAQVDTTLDRAQGGLGIGLTLVKSLVELHGGRVEVSSAGVGRGSEFVVRLPAVAGGPAGPPEASADDGPVVPRRVLVVDDNKDSADSLATLLELGGHEVKTAHNGPRALEAVAAFRPEVVLLDLGLPGMSGFEVARSLRERHDSRDALIVAMTGYGQDTDRERSREAGFDVHLVKPVDPKDVRRLLSAGRKAAAG